MELLFLFTWNAKVVLFNEQVIHDWSILEKSETDLLQSKPEERRLFSLLECGRPSHLCHKRHNLSEFILVWEVRACWWFLILGLVLYDPSLSFPVKRSLIPRPLGESVTFILLLQVVLLTSDQQLVLEP